MYNNDFELIDFHTHILPNMDDGSESIEMSVEMLTLLKQQGVDKVVASSHYYGNGCSISDFCEKRDKAVLLLENHIKENNLDLPEIIPAAEVKIFPGLWKEKELGRLCVNNSKAVLLEMPYEKWSGWMYNEVYGICVRGFLPVMVHVERYLKDYASQEEILKKLLSMNVLAQCNAESAATIKKRSLLKKIINQNKLVAVGSDSHNMSDRKPDFNLIINHIEKKYGAQYLHELMKKSNILINGNAFDLI